MFSRKTSRILPVDAADPIANEFDAPWSASVSFKSGVNGGGVIESSSTNDLGKLVENSPPLPRRYPASTRHFIAQSGKVQFPISRLFLPLSHRLEKKCEGMLRMVARQLKVNEHCINCQ